MIYVPILLQKKKDMPTAQQRRKHQITYLAYQVSRVCHVEGKFQDKHSLFLLPLNPVFFIITTVVENKSNDLDDSDCKYQIDDRRFCYDCCRATVRHNPHRSPNFLFNDHMETRLYKDQERPLPYTFLAIQAKKLNIEYTQGCKLLEHNVVSSPVILKQVLVSQLMGNPITTTK